jgi:hypothetical protein
MNTLNFGISPKNMNRCSKRCQMLNQLSKKSK